MTSVLNVLQMPTEALHLNVDVIKVTMIWVKLSVQNVIQNVLNVLIMISVSHHVPEKESTLHPVDVQNICWKLTKKLHVKLVTHNVGDVTLNLITVENVHPTESVLQSVTVHIGLVSMNVTDVLMNNTPVQNVTVTVIPVKTPVLTVKPVLVSDNILMNKDVSAQMVCTITEFSHKDTNSVPIKSVPMMELVSSVPTIV
jgi:hypothetical protein